MVDINLEKLLESGAHFGHQTKRWNPKMAPYIYGVKEGISIFDLVKTKEALGEALETLSSAVGSGKMILFVGTKRQVQDKIREVATALNQPFVSERWLGGTLTNFEQVKASVRKLGEMREAREKGEYNQYTKKERLLIDREIEKLEKKVGGLSTLSRLPDLIFIVDTHKEYSAVREALKMNIEIVGLTDSNADPSLIDWPVPMNDDASAALDYVLDLVKEAMTPLRSKASEGQGKKVKKAPKKKAKK